MQVVGYTSAESHQLRAKARDERLAQELEPGWRQGHEDDVMGEEWRRQWGEEHVAAIDLVQRTRALAGNAQVMVFGLSADEDDPQGGKGWWEALAGGLGAVMALHSVGSI